MPPERFPPDDPREWMNRARSNLIQARQQSPGVYLEDLCFNAQQAAEKAIKALLLHRAIQFPYIHDIAKLLNLLREAGESIPPQIEDADALSQYAVGTRSPTSEEPVTQQEYEEALAVAEAVVCWAEERLQAEYTR